MASSMCAISSWWNFYGSLQLPRENYRGRQGEYCRCLMTPFEIHQVSLQVCKSGVVQILAYHEIFFVEAIDHFVIIRKVMVREGIELSGTKRKIWGSKKTLFMTFPVWKKKDQPHFNFMVLITLARVFSGPSRLSNMMFVSLNNRYFNVTTIKYNKSSFSPLFHFVCLSLLLF